eukprot:TRINITY_DN45459_c0_g1_i1.p1 TRINITY_DN45459_c0_g1~~TRINITY_DN45459_c0_g1_i1.p1  ORF type:complete len:118 (+),score=35.91 TRINITY_DN45459_c0_g1_i1:328-681(+)
MAEREGHDPMTRKRGAVQASEDPDGKKPKLVLKRTNCSPVRGGLAADDPLAQLVPDSDSDHDSGDDSDGVEAQFLAGLTKEQKKELLKRYTAQDKKSKKDKKEKKKKKDKKSKKSKA